MQDVVVAVLTYRRNDILVGLLPMLIKQAASVAPAPAQVLVVDNDPDAGARDAVAPFAPAVRYVHEPEPGIAAGRNRAMDEIADDALLVFIDDDEMPVDGWLNLLLDTYHRFHPDAVSGRVDREFSEPLEPWLLEGGFFINLRGTTGNPVRAAATNNLLLDMRTVRRMGLRFDPLFGLSGGSDTLFTRQLIARGGVIVWNDEAVVYDQVPVSRAMRQWAIRRSFRSGNAWSRSSVHLAESGPARLKARIGGAVLGGSRALGGIGQFLWGALLRRDLRARAQGVRRTARGMGMLSGALGYVYVEYRRTAAKRRRFLPKLR